MGPSTLNGKIIKQISKIGVSLFRINLSHTNISELKDIITFIRKYSNIPICLDTQGSQIRTQHIHRNKIKLELNNLVKNSGIELQ